MEKENTNEIEIRTMFEKSDPAVMQVFAEHLLAVAVEGGIDYWANIIKVDYDDNGYNLVVISEGDAEMQYGLTPNRVIDGFIDLAADAGNTDKMSKSNYERLVQEFKAAMLEKDPENLDLNFDAEDGDCFVQWLVLGQIKYG